MEIKQAGDMWPRGQKVKKKERKKEKELLNIWTQGCFLV
jgi:hypothetical protein